MNSFQELDVWKVSIELAKEIYRTTKALPKDETYGLTSQLRRAAVSISANIAEGYGRNNRGEYLQFLGIASGSIAELETLMILASDIYPEVSFIICQEKCERVGRMLTKLKQSLKN